MPLINFEVSLVLTWSKNGATTDASAQEADPNDDPPVPEIRDSTGIIFKIEDTNLYVPVITLSTQDNHKLLQQLKKGFKRTIKWNKCRSEMSNQTKETI